MFFFKIPFMEYFLDCIFAFFFLFFKIPLWLEIVLNVLYKKYLMLFCAV